MGPYICAGTDRMSASSIKEYFGPLYEWLKTENAAANECYGWGFNDYPDAVKKTLAQPRCGMKLDKSSSRKNAASG